MEKRNETYGVIQGARLITRTLTDRGVLNRFLQNFSPTYDEIMREKKYLFIECEGFQWVHIYDTDEQLLKMLSKQNCHIKEDDECYVEEICKEITYDEFIEMAKGKHMDFEKYSTLDGDLIFDFDEEI